MLATPLYFARSINSKELQTMKTILHVAGRDIEVDAKRVLTNDVRLPWESHPWPLFAVCYEYGFLGACFAESESDALDELCDANLLAGLLIEESDADDETPRVGNFGEPCDLTHCQISKVRLDKSLDFDLLMCLAEARGKGADTLYDV